MTGFIVGIVLIVAVFVFFVLTALAMKGNEANEQVQVDTATDDAASSNSAAGAQA